ncbi:MAG TPA: DUF2497 domain-containing protein [Stellaceae bacterium]|nr:DUF2497 domain-containing protein [Stellaceae bacterium]
MEEILASIRRIISEDNEAPEAGAAAADGKPAGAPEAAAAAELAAQAARTAPAADDDVLELTEVVGEDDPVANSPEAAEPVHPEPEPEPQHAHADSDAAEAARLLSSTSAAASVAALSQLVNRPRDRSGELPLGNAERTLEDLVRELIRPLLKSWMDDNLPQLVERLVRDEITRLVREAQGR